MTLTPLTYPQKQELLMSVISHGSMKNQQEWDSLIRRLADPEFDSDNPRDWDLIEGALRNRLAYDDYVRRDPAWYADVLAAIDYATRRAYALDWPQHNPQAFLDCACEGAGYDALPEEV